jgi:hypothetical protein
MTSDIALNHLLPVDKEVYSKWQVINVNLSWRELEFGVLKVALQTLVTLVTPNSG